MGWSPSFRWGVLPKREVSCGNAQVSLDLAIMLYLVLNYYMAFLIMIVIVVCFTHTASEVEVARDINTEVSDE